MMAPSTLLLLVALLVLGASAQVVVPMPVVPSDNGTVQYITLFFTAQQFTASRDYFTNADTWALGTDLLFQDMGLPAARFQLDRAPEDDISANRQIQFKKLIFRVLPASSPFMTFLIFGDSLVDDQNYWLSQQRRFPPSPPYFFGAFTNGPTFVNSMRAQMRTPSTGYLNNGLGLATLDQVYAKITGFLAARSRSVTPEMLIFHNGGAYDLLNAFAGVLSGRPFNSTVLIGQLVSKTYRNVQALVQAGARKLVVMDITNLSGSPLVTFLNAFVAPGLTPQVAGLTALANQAIRANITGDNAEWAAIGVHITYVSSSSALSAIVASPAGYGINDTVNAALTPCCFPSGQLIPGLGLPQFTNVAPDANYKLFFDDTMPSGTTHYWMSQAVFDALDTDGLLAPDACTSQPLAEELAETALNMFNRRQGLRVPRTCEGQLAATFGCTKQVYGDSAATRLDAMDFLYAEPGIASGAAALALCGGAAVLAVLLAALL